MLDPSPHGVAIDILRLTKKIKPLQAKVLREMVGADIDFCYVSFAYLMRRTGLPRSDVKRIVRQLAKMGLATYAKGLFSEDGNVAGSGYGATPTGHTVARIVEERADDRSYFSP